LVSKKYENSTPFLLKKPFTEAANYFKEIPEKESLWDGESRNHSVLRTLIDLEKVDRAMFSDSHKVTNNQFSMNLLDATFSTSG
jgi:hypothetical protein